MSTTSARAPLPDGALEEYAGKWIAVREGDVVASADSYEKLRAQPNVIDDDATFHVPPATALFY